MWDTDPLATADRLLLHEGPDALRKSFEENVLRGAPCPGLTRVRGMVQDVNRNGHFAMGRVGADGTARLLQDFDPLYRPQATWGNGTADAGCAAREVPFEACFVYVVPVPGGDAHHDKSHLTGMTAVNPKKRQLDADTPGAPPGAAPPSHLWGALDRARNFPKEHANDDQPSFVVRLILPDAGDDSPDSAPKLNSIIEVYGHQHHRQEGMGGCVLPNQESFLMDLPFSSYAAASPGKTGEISAVWWSTVAFPAALLRGLPAPHSQLRGELLSHLSAVMCGDAVAAEALMLHLLSNVFDVNPVPLGSVALNITGVAVEDVPRVVRAVKQLCSPAVAYGVTVPELNQADWVPRMDYEKEALQSGKLQLPDAAHLVLDETRLVEGRLTQLGVANLKAIQQVAAEGKLQYPYSPDFSLDVEVKTPVLVLSKSQSLLKPVHNVRLVKAASAEGQGDAFMDVEAPDSLLASLRDYVSACRGASDVSLAPGFEEIVATTIGAGKQQFGSKFKESAAIAENTIHCWMTLARLHATSLGESHVTPSHWQHAVALGGKILSRLS